MTSLITRADKQYDKQLLNQYFLMLETLPRPTEGDIEYPIDINMLNQGLVLSQAVGIDITEHSPPLSKGTLIDEHHIEKLKELAKQGKISSTIFVTH